MSATQLRTTSVPAEADQRPRDDELDLFGLTHTGKVRQENQDQFLLCTVHPQVVTHGTSLASPESLPLRGDRLATAALAGAGRPRLRVIMASRLILAASAGAGIWAVARPRPGTRQWVPCSGGRGIATAAFGYIGCPHQPSRHHDSNRNLPDRDGRRPPPQARLALDAVWPQARVRS